MSRARQRITKPCRPRRNRLCSSTRRQQEQQQQKYKQQQPPSCRWRMRRVLGAHTTLRFRFANNIYRNMYHIHTPRHHQIHRSKCVLYLVFIVYAIQFHNGIHQWNTVLGGFQRSRGQRKTHKHTHSHNTRPHKHISSAPTSPCPSVGDFTTVMMTPTSARIDSAIISSRDIGGRSRHLGDSGSCL